jgi:uncharacterized protein (DUF427 family)
LIRRTRQREAVWKGNAFYDDVSGERNERAAWSYPDPKPEARHIKDRAAFWQGAEVLES